MRKSHLLLPFILGVSCLASCGGSGPEPLPTTDKEKVAFAFKGVDKSLRNQRAANRKLLPLNAIRTDEGVAEMYRQFDETRDVEAPDIEYNEPPLVQFQFIKQLYEAVGDDYALGTVYTTTVTGEVTYDFDTGKYEGDLHRYSAEVDIYIGIDSKDYITAEFGMQIVYTAPSGQTHEQKFYAYLGLDYDFERNEPNYTLSMRNSDDCSAYPEDQVYCSYEYDYVEVQEGAILEWRKAYVAANRKLILDQAHPDFASYMNEGLEFSGGARAYKNHKQYKTTRTGKKSDNPEDTAKRIALCTTVVDKLGGNASDIHADAFFAKDKVQNAKVKEIYNGFSHTYGVDIVASIVITGSHIYEHGGEPQQEPTHLRLLNAVTGRSVSFTDVAILEDDTATFADLIDNVDVYLADSPLIPQVDLLDDNGTFVRKASASDLRFIATFQGSDGQHSIDVNSADNVMGTVGAYGADYMLLGLDYHVGDTLMDHVEFFVAWGESQKEIDGWPKDLIKQYGLEGYLPSFISATPNATAQGLDTGDGFDLYIKGVSEEEIADYAESMESYGAALCGKGIHYLINNTKKIFTALGETDGYALKLAIRYAPDEYKISYSDADKAIFSELSQDVLLPTFTAFRHPFSSSPEVFYYYGVSEGLLEAFEGGLIRNGWAINSEGNAEVALLDGDSGHYEIRFERGDFALIVTYTFTGGEQPPEPIDYQPMYLILNGDMEFPMGNDLDGNPVFEGPFGATSAFYLLGGPERQYFFGYSSLSEDSKDLECIAEGDNDWILIAQECLLKVKLVFVEGAAPMIVITNESGGGEEGQGFECEVSLIRFKMANLTGSFNNWNPSDSSYGLAYNETTSSYSITAYFDTDTQFKLTFDSSWNNCLGYNQMPIFTGYPEFFASQGEESNVKVLQPINMTLEISEIKGETMKLKLVAQSAA